MRFFRSSSLLRKAKKKLSRSREEYEMQDMPSEQPVLEQSSPTVPPLIPPPSPSSSESSMVTVTGSPRCSHDESTVSSEESSSWITAEPGETLARDETIEPTPALLVRQECNAPLSDDDGDQTTSDASGPALTGQSAILSSQLEASPSPFRESASPTENEHLLDDAEQACSRSGGNTEDEVDSDEDPTSYHIEDVTDCPPTDDSPPSMPTQPSRNIASEVTYRSITTAEFDMMLQSFETSSSRHTRREHDRSAHMCVLEAEVAGLEVLRDDLGGSHIKIEELIGRDPNEHGEAPRVRSSGPRIVSTQPGQMSSQDINDASSSEPLSSHSSDEFEGIATNTPADDDRWEHPPPLDLRYLGQELEAVVQERTHERRPSNPSVTRWNRYRFRNPTQRCSHDKLLRYFVDPDDTEQEHVCDYCGEAPRVLYSCVADTADYSGYDSDEEPRRDIRILPQWTQKAIAVGEYTPEQVEKLLDNKIRVILLTSQERQIISYQTRYALQRAQASMEEWLAGAAEAREAGAGYRNLDHAMLDHVLFARQPCREMACGSCLDKLTERAWGLIDEVVHEPYQEPPQIPEYLSRPISDAAVLRAMPRFRIRWQRPPPSRRWSC